MTDEKGRSKGFDENRGSAESARHGASVFVVAAVAIVAAALIWFTNFGGLKESGAFEPTPALALLVATSAVAYYAISSAEAFGIFLSADHLFIVISAAVVALALSALLFGSVAVATASIGGALALMGLAPAVALYVRLMGEKKEG